MPRAGGPGAHIPHLGKTTGHLPHDGDQRRWRHRFRDFEATKLWRWATPYNYMFLQWEDFQNRLGKIKELLNNEIEPEKKFWEYANNIIHRYPTRRNCLEHNNWMRRRWELLRGHKGVLADSAYPYMLTRNKLSRDKLEIYKSMSEWRIEKHGRRISNAAHGSRERFNNDSRECERDMG